MIDLSFQHPWAWTAAVPAGAAAWWLTARLDVFPAVRRVVLAVRVLGVIALAGWAAGPTAPDPDAGPVLVVGIDVSKSHRTAAGDAMSLAAEALRGWDAPPDVRTAVVLFGDVARVVRPARPGLPTAEDWTSWSREAGPSADATDLAAALRAMNAAAAEAGVAARGSPAGGRTGRLLLFTDGRDTTGRGAKAGVPADGGVPADVWTAGFLPSPDARVVGLRLPARAMPGTTVTGSVTLQANRTSDVVVSVTRSAVPPGGGTGTGAGAAPTVVEVARLRARLVPDVPVRLGFSEAGLPEGVHTFRAELRTPPAGGTGGAGPALPAWLDALPENDALTAAVEVAVPDALLLVTGGPAEDAAAPGTVTAGTDAALEAAVRAAWRGPVVRMRADDARLASPAELRRFAGVVLADAPSAAAPGPVRARAGTVLGAPAVRALAEWVRGSGGGLLVIGGEASFGAGGWHLGGSGAGATAPSGSAAGTPAGGGAAQSSAGAGAARSTGGADTAVSAGGLDDVLPVQSDPRSRRPTALVFVIDRSASMANPADPSGARTRMDVARQAVAALAPPVLHGRDEVAVVGVNDRAVLTRPLAPGADAVTLNEATRPLTPTGGTAVLKGIEAALAQLATARTAARRIIVVTDGESSDLDPVSSQDDDRQRLSRIREGLLAGRVRLTVIVAGGDGSPGLRQLAEATGGRYEQPSDFLAVPGRLLEDLFTAGEFHRGGGVPIRAGEAELLPATSALVAAAEGGALPPVGRMCRTVLRPEGRAVLVSDDGDPLLALREAGLGRTAAWTGGTSPAWTGGWREGLRPVLADVLAWTMRPSRDPEWHLAAEWTGRTVLVTLTSLRSPPPDLAEPVVRFGGAAARGQVVTSPLIGLAPGRLSAEWQPPASGPVEVVVATPGMRPMRTAITAGHPAEVSDIGFDEPAVSDLCRATDGRMVAAMAEVDLRPRGPGPARSRGGWFLAVALAAACADVGLLIAQRKGML